MTFLLTSDTVFEAAETPSGHIGGTGTVGNEQIEFCKDYASRIETVGIVENRR